MQIEESIKLLEEFITHYKFHESVYRNWNTDCIAKTFVNNWFKANKDESVNSILRSDIFIEARKESLTESHNIKFSIGQDVYLKTDNMQKERIVTGITLRPNNGVTYCLSCNEEDSWHYDIEINKERDILKATSN